MRTENWDLKDTTDACAHKDVRATMSFVVLVTLCIANVTIALRFPGIRIPGKLTTPMRTMPGVAAPGFPR